MIWADRRRFMDTDKCLNLSILITKAATLRRLISNLALRSTNISVRTITILLAFSLLCNTSRGLNAKSAGDEDIQVFLTTVRNQPYQESIAILNGRINHKNINGEKLKFSIELRLKLNSNHILGQIIFNEYERYRLQQNVVTGKSSFQKEASSENPKSSSLASLGFVPGDFTLSFLHWNFETELNNERIKGQKCRVVILKHPEENKKVKVWISRKYYFPLKVEWTDEEAVVNPYKTISFTGFERENNFWIIKEFKIKGVKGKSVVQFENNMVRLIDENHPIPNDFFIDHSP